MAAMGAFDFYSDLTFKFKVHDAFSADGANQSFGLHSGRPLR